MARPFSRAGQNILQDRQEAAPDIGAGGAWARPGTNGGWWARTTNLRNEREERSRGERVGPKTPPELGEKNVGASEDGGGAGRPPRTPVGGGVGMGTREQKNGGHTSHQHPFPHLRAHPPPTGGAEGGGSGRGGGGEGSADGRLSPLEISKTGGVKIGRRGWASGGGSVPPIPFHSRLLRSFRICIRDR